MTSGLDLRAWIHGQYANLGLDAQGIFIGKESFKSALITAYPRRNGETPPDLRIRQEVNKFKGMYAPRDIQSETPTETSTSPTTRDPGSSTASRHHDPCPNSVEEAMPGPSVSRSFACHSKIQALKGSLTKVGPESGDVLRASNTRLSIPTLAEQTFLLGDLIGDTALDDLTAKASVCAAPLFSKMAFDADTLTSPIQYGLLGHYRAPTSELGVATDRRLFHNTNIPFSTFICGLQGSGKSHTLSCLIENCLIPDPKLGLLKTPLSVLVLHFSQYTSNQTFRPCEAAFLAAPSSPSADTLPVAPVRVMVAPSNYESLRAFYTQIPGVTVQPLKLQSRDLTVSSMLSLMSVDQTKATPLYMSQVTKVLREMAVSSSEEFNYPAFKQRLMFLKLDKRQQRPLQQRLELLESFLDLDGWSNERGLSGGGVIIVDLSCPFVDANLACVLFNICMSTFIGSDQSVGKIIAVDEAHQYMINTPGATMLTDSILTLIREQRHYGVRVIVSTQEPTISPRILDLCSVIIIHRFSSPDWFTTLQKHVSTASETQDHEVFQRIMSLRVGEALVSSPSSLVVDGEDRASKRLGVNLLHVKVRHKITWDGGKSIVCV